MQNYTANQEEESHNDCDAKAITGLFYNIKQLLHSEKLFSSPKDSTNKTASKSSASSIQ